jgi:hypothetical protein
MAKKTGKYFNLAANASEENVARKLMNLEVVLA